ncbi:Fumarylacetoacetate (FAA) hydrolase family protein [Streptomyces zhaozhouensis]|uniref:Fumarylacetoacetate (FAA) hydrolase family protein n=1 Tax=Streptomyces zhaozhouensis TaxID=1300267 RepID=A0A286DU30_9ACTN|nr:fumarylacetoacetate hydrolase family protein [Streptomyces zhaozhouensis]SOD62074.1 Fumarylacetoacetate (FAA) hydrolase family protein [Streptomyces zhaozhouensis]
MTDSPPPHQDTVPPARQAPERVEPLAPVAQDTLTEGVPGEADPGPVELTALLPPLLPEDADRATLVGRVFDPEVGGPCVVAVRGDRLVDLTPFAPTMSELLERPDVAEFVRSAPAERAFPLEEVLAATLGGARDRPRLLAPCDLQALKACGVTFVRSMVERVIEERAKGDRGGAAEVRERVLAAIGGRLEHLVPGSEEAARVKEVLTAEGLWSQYLEVGIGPDAEVFTKAPVLSAVGAGAEIGVWSRSEWNNPEPELVLAVDSVGRVVGATLGNDVNLRDVEGRSALLLGKAKDNNASTAVGPFLRLLDAEFTLDDVRDLDITLTITGRDGFRLESVSSLSEISRDPVDLVGQTIGRLHQYPDGLLLFTGTMFAPTQDRDAPGEGFTHHLGDLVRISTPRLGTLANVVTHSETAEPWTFGIRSLMSNLAARGLLTDPVG